MAYVSIRAADMGTSPNLREKGGMPTRAQQTAEAFAFTLPPFPGWGGVRPIWV
jgi:hypothetical protein